MTLKPSKSLLIGLATALLLAAGPVSAQTMMFMHDTPYTHFTKEDHALFDAAMTEALDKGADGASSSWSNPATKASGELKPVQSFDRNGKKCRKLYIANKARGRSASGEYNFCKQPSGKWALAN